MKTELSEYPAGLSQGDIEFIMQNDVDVVSLERIDGAKAMWKASVSVEGATPVQMIADNGINEIYFQVLIRIDSDHIVEALTAISPYAVLGLSFVGDGGLFIRGAFYVEFSNMHALTNTYRAAALAYGTYERAINGLTK
ncbi:hypothetical protein AB4Y72_15085 [Arthrobacter sp. YAF34]|uniref:hypothetical protein n=1 Tax=Arthrobacter sp. YAF34 TaxID=3233083 RepID=UPI003F930347